jgi:fumarate reductase flavoprotein subunit
VLILEASGALGGATSLSGGVVYAAGTSVQAAAGVTDSADAMYNHMMALNQWSLRPSLARTMSEGGAIIMDWLVELGNEYPPELLVVSGVELVPRGHQTLSQGRGVADSLVRAVRRQDKIEVALDSRVTRLLLDDGAVVGVVVDDSEVRGRTVVLTTGGFGNDPELVKRLWPTAAAHGARVFSVYEDAPFVNGDGIRLGESAGARLAGLDTGLLNPTPNFAHNINGFLPKWSLIVNRDGMRFVPESASYAVSGYLINEQPEMRCFAVFDEPTMLEACADENIERPYESDPGTQDFRIDVIRQQAATGKVKVGATIDEVAARADISVAGLKASIDRYNALCAQGEDTDFLKESRYLNPIATGPFYAVEIRANMIGSGHAGLEIDSAGRVVDSMGEAIPGLYAGGEVVGGTLGRRYLGGGMGIANALIFGRLAGLTAAADVST